MSPEALRALLAQPPHDKLDFLPDQTTAEAIAATLAAFANREGGLLLLGVTPSGIVTGLSDPDEMEQRALTALLQV
ncbi:MAG: RNA-binding domain-containing protein, partial [Ardenticatenaceae bacterium]